MYLRPPFADETAKISDWIKVRQCGIKYYLSLGDQRIIDKNFIIRPKVEFEVGINIQVSEKTMWKLLLPLFVHSLKQTVLIFVILNNLLSCISRGTFIFVIVFVFYNE